MVATSQGDTSVEAIEQIMTNYTYEQLLNMIAPMFGGDISSAQAYVYQTIDQVLTSEGLEFIDNEANSSATTVLGVGNISYSPTAFVTGYKNIVGRKGNALEAINSITAGSEVENHGANSIVGGERVQNYGSNSIVVVQETSQTASDFTKDGVPNYSALRYANNAAYLRSKTTNEDAKKFLPDTLQYEEGMAITTDTRNMDVEIKSGINHGSRSAVFGSGSNFSNHSLVKGENSFVVDGTNNAQFGGQSFMLNTNNSIMSGLGNFAERCSAVNVSGQQNTLKNVLSSIVSGDSHKIKDSQYLAVSGATHTITGVRDGVVSGRENNVDGSKTQQGYINCVQVNGYKNTVTADRAVVNGYSNEVGATSGVVFGERNKLPNGNQAFSMLSGEGLVRSADIRGGATFGRYNVNVPAQFVVGIGTSDTDRKNAFEVYKDGRAKVYSAPKDPEDVVRLADLNE